MSIFFKLFNKWLCKKDKAVAVNLIKHIAHIKKVSLVMTAYQEMGILKHLEENCGEDFLIKVFLNNRFKNINQPVLFDVGANRGDFANILHGVFPNAIIHAFEPISSSYRLLKANCNHDNVILNNVGLGFVSCKTEMYHYNDGFANQHASLYAEVLSEIHNQQKVVSEEISINSIDDYCSMNGITTIDFLKIDTEGNELNVLKGAQRMINSNSINIIQFEFNEMNIISRVFLKDFYTILRGYEFYRLNTNELLPLGKYKSINEIFQFQNIFAIKK